MDDVDTLRRLNATEQRLGQIYDQIACTYVPLRTALTEASGALAGAALNVGTYTVGPLGGGATYSFAYPSSAKALIVVLSATWAAASNASYAYMRPSGSAAADATVFCNAHVANFADRQTGIVNLSTSAQAQIVIVNANSTAFYLSVLGYFL